MRCANVNHVVQSVEADVVFATVKVMLQCM